jgi:hypothetical protein
MAAHPNQATQRAEVTVRSKPSLPFPMQALMMLLHKA